MENFMLMSINCDCLPCLNNDKITEGFIPRPKTLGEAIKNSVLTVHGRKCISLTKMILKHFL